MLRSIDNLLNRITMYRLVLYVLIALLGIAVVLSAFGGMGYNPFALLFSIGFLLAVCALANWLFAKAFKIPANAESTYISALILALIISPIQSYNDLWFLGWAAVLAMASKYIVAINKRHIFNPVAFAVAITYFTINQSASWWVGDAPMLPFVIIGGLLIVRKIARFELVSTFFLSAVASIIVFSLLNGNDFLAGLQRTIVYSPILFFAFIILTEPLTTPPNQKLRAIYGALTGFFFAPQIHFGSFYITPELAMLIGNLFSFVVSPKSTLILTLKDKIRVAPDIYDFIFMPDRKLTFTPGQYMEWTLGHDDPDSRGNRRFFTLASSPTEDHLRLGVKFYPNGSSFKQAMLKMDHQHEIVATQLAGDFVLPNDPNQKCVFIAGGVGITPFRSMIKYLMDTRQRRSIVLFYVNRSINDIIYKDVFDKAHKQLGLKTIYTVTDPRELPAAWQGKIGHITPELIKAEVPDYRHCVFYISGPKGLVDSFKELLSQLHVPDTHIKTDFFAGLA
jgi:glycine betaine catabolism B